MRTAILIILSILCIAIIGLYLYIRIAPRTVPDVQFYDETLGIYHTLAIDLDGDGRISENTVLSGEDTVIVINEDQLPNTPQTAPRVRPNLFVINGLQSLARFDLNVDNVIDSQDPIWPAVNVMVFKRGSYQGVLNAADVGVRAININKTYVLYEVTDNEARKQIQPAEIVMSDSTLRKSMILDLDTKLFE